MAYLMPAHVQSVRQGSIVTLHQCRPQPRIFKPRRKRAASKENTLSYVVRSRHLAGDCAHVPFAARSLDVARDDRVVVVVSLHLDRSAADVGQSYQPSLRSRQSGFAWAISQSFFFRLQALIGHPADNAHMHIQRFRCHGKIGVMPREATGQILTGC